MNTLNWTNDGILVPSLPYPRPQEKEMADGLPADTNSRIDSVLLEVARLRAEVEKNSETNKSKAESSDSSDRPDPSEDSAIWNLNSMSVLMWKSIFWPTGKQWNHDTEQFENHKSFSKIQIRSRSQHWLESNVCPLLFTFVPMALVFIEICILAGTMIRSISNGLLT
jgi:hypothetical protein